MLFLDLETYSETPIQSGTHAYAEAAEILLVAFAWDDEPVTVWDMTDGTRDLGQVQMMIDAANTVVIHNSHFDRTVLRHRGVHIPVEKIHDTMVQALAHSLPGSLGTLCDVLGVPSDKAKDKEGKKLIQLLTKPRAKNVKVRRATRETHPDEWQAFIEYARLDVDAMRDVYGRLPNWNNSLGERTLWQLDQRINDRGVAIDLDLARSAVRAFQRTLRSLADASALLTDGALGSLTQRQKLLDHLSVKHGFTPADLTKGTVAALIKGDLDPDVRTLLENRQQASATSPAKYTVVQKAASSDGRLRGTIQFCGASRTGRDAGRIFQPQNLPRPSLKPEQIEMGIEAMKLDCEDLIYDNVSELCSSAVRGCMVAEKGNKLVVADLSNIEGRVLAWAASEDWKITAFSEFDRGIGHDLYKLAYARSFGKKAEDVTKSERQIGKVQELALGYGGGPGAFVKMAAIYGIELPEDEVVAIVKAWRKAHPAVTSLWYACEQAARDAIRSPTEAFKVRDLEFTMANGWLRMRLPSGRYLCYPDARIEDGRLSYGGTNQYTRKWERLETYGGKLCIAQGTLVLTDGGWLPIEHVTSLHKVWDGVEWVTNGGLARKGVKEVICLDGVWMTPDHEVLTTEGWVRASQSEGLERADARIPYGRAVPRKRRASITVVAPLPVWEGDHPTCDRDNQAAKTRDTGVVRVHAGQDYIREADNAWDVSAQGVCGLAQHDRPMFVADASGLGALRRAWDNGMRSVAKVIRRFLGRYGTDVQRGAYAGASRQFRRIQPLKLRMGYPYATGTKQTEQLAHRHTVGANDRVGSSGSVGAEQDHIVLPSERGRARFSTIRGTRYVTEVYDLVNCGPRSRFVVAGERGETFIVHNCENAVQAIARDIFMGGMRRAEDANYPVCVRVHDELICETPDTPEYNVAGLVECMVRGESWSTGLPLAAAGHEMYRYAKLD